MKRVREDDDNDNLDSLRPNPKRCCLRSEEPLPPTPPLTASFGNDDSPPSQLVSKPKNLKRALERGPNDPAAPTTKSRFRYSLSASEPGAGGSRRSWYVRKWLRDSQSKAFQERAEEKAEGVDGQTIERSKGINGIPNTGELEDSETLATPSGAPVLEAATDPSMSLRDGDSQRAAGSVSGSSNKISTSSASFRGVQRAHGIVHDKRGTMILPEVRATIDKHIRKSRDG